MYFNWKQKLVLMIAIIIMNVATNQVMAEVNLQNGHVKSAQPDSFKPITFPESEEVVHDRFSESFAMPPPSLPPPTTNPNALIPTGVQKVPAPMSSVPLELERPTRVAVAATSSSDRIPSQYPDEQLDYVRDFSWNMFQVLNESSFNLIKSKVIKLFY